MRLIVAACIACTFVEGQPAFEVASVRQAAGPQAGRMKSVMNGGPGTADPGRIAYTNLTMETILGKAFTVRHDQIVGPDWLPLARFDITANAPPDATQEQFLSMLRNLLVERFAMAAHLEKRDYLSYALVVGKNGPKMKESHSAESSGKPQASAASGDSPRFTQRSASVSGGEGHVNGVKMSMAQLAKILAAEFLDRPVVDMTGLAGDYDFTLTFPFTGTGSATRQFMLMLGGAPPQESPETENGIFEALQRQIGLKLERMRSPEDFLIVDHIEKMPTPN